MAVCFCLLEFHLFHGAFLNLQLFVRFISFAYGWIIIRRLVVDYNYAPIFINGCTMLGAGFIALILSVVTEPMLVTGNLTQFALVLAAVILISNIVVHTLYISLLKKYSLTFIQLCSLSAPLFVHYRSLSFAITLYRFH